MNTALQKFSAWVLLAGLSLVIAACGGGGGGGGGGGAVPMATISVATKGVIQGASVTVHQLLSDGRTGSLLGSGGAGVGGVYSVDIPSSQTVGPLLVTVAGQTGAKRDVSVPGATTPVDFTAAEAYHAVANNVAPGQIITVSILTEAAYKKLQQILTVSPALATPARIAGAVDAANARIAALFGIDNLLADPAGDTTYQAALLILDQMIIDLAPGNTVTLLNLINPAFANVASPAYQTYLNALIAAANKAALANPALAAEIQAIVALASAPPAEPDWTDLTAPTAPSNLAATTTSLTASTSSVALSWSPATDANGIAGYDVYRDGAKIATVTTVAYTDQPLANNATYNYFIIAFDAAGNRSVASSSLAVPVAVAATDVTPPTAPGNLSASTFALSQTTSSVVLMWSPATDNKAVTAYEIYRDGSLIATVATPGYTDPLVSISTTYLYYVVAMDAAGNRSVPSNQLSVTPNQPSLGVVVNGQLSTGIIVLPGSDVIAPTAPSSLTATTFALTATTSSVVLSWSPSTDNTAVIGYEVYRNGVRISTVAAPGYTDPSVASGSTYTYFIMAFDAAGNRSIASNQLLVTPNQPSLGVTVNGQLSTGIISLPIPDVVAPTAPSNLSAVVSAVTATTSSVVLSWTPSTDNVAVTGYEVYRNGVRISTVTVPGYTEPSVTAGVQYTYFIMAFDAAGNRSIASNQLIVTPQPGSLNVIINGQLIF
ncbi:MAG: hypothetical protein A2X82_03335 [Geobacteraceae bacterium GWC2_55_20]|nr:MAG: hypothetical protein A2X82_03335 [Geobacteraceae bacterium GWC2_55_20]OGU23649.1 MAG: hypothetical protein A2X85_15570 [Geobacteraceae bacterium GWF2_54_21]HBA71842.1 hypothetical protein [Geobacter sp.]HCE69099.1 hypothetical protein [Geobacter sp.]